MAQGVGVQPSGQQGSAAGLFQLKGVGAGDGVHLLGSVEMCQRLRHPAEQRRRATPIAPSDGRLEPLLGGVQQ